MRRSRATAGILEAWRTLDTCRDYLEELGGHDDLEVVEPKPAGRRRRRARTTGRRLIETHLEALGAVRG
jgi:hypothetical protein